MSANSSMSENPHIIGQILKEESEKRKEKNEEWKVKNEKWMNLKDMEWNWNIRKA